MLKEQVREKLYKIQDLKYKKFHSSLCPNVDNIIGVQVPKLRNIAKELAKTNSKEYLELDSVPLVAKINMKKKLYRGY